MKHFSYWCMAVLFLIPFVCDGQLNGVDLSAIEATTPLTADQMPIYGTFYSAAHPLIPPLPANIWGLSGWSLDNGYYLLDDLDDSSGGGGFHAMAESAPFPPGYYGGGSNYTFTSSITPYVFPTNGLWLWITNVTNGTVYANLNGATDYVYEVFSTQNLLAGPPVSNWSIETEVFPGVHTNTMPFTVPTAGRNPLFVWARDWTGITSNGNTTPDWWFWLYFKTTDLLDTDPDSQGSTLVSDYLSKTDPNVINFLLNFTNYYSGTANISAFVGVQHGIPFYQAVLINDTNTADAVWQSCTGTNVPVTLGSTNGLYTVNVGLRGFPASGTQTWKSGLITLYFNAPAVDIINPTSTIVYEPSIRIQGYANHVLGSVIFDISNAAGIYANQSGFLTGQFYDTNSINDTTNYFECDPNLSVGTNFITLHAIDWAGNSTNIHLTLDYIPQTNASVINILWPQSGMAISGSNFTVQAQVENAVSIKASITDTNGATDTVQGLIEDNGTAWVQNLPLSGGTNIVTVIATGQDGTMVITNLNVVENDVGLYVFPLNTFNDQLNQSSVTVNGQINDPSLCVYVNGVKANYTDDFGDWEADQVPVSPYGTAVLSVQVYEGDPVLVASQNYYQPQPVAVGMMSYSGRHDLGYSGPGTETINWDYLTGGKYTPIPSASYDAFDITSNENGVAYTTTIGGNGQPLPFIMPWEYASLTTFQQLGFPFGNNTQTRVMIEPGGQITGGQTNLYLVFANASEFSSLKMFFGFSDGDYGYPYFSMLAGVGGIVDHNGYFGDVPLPPEWLQINGKTLVSSGITNADGSVSGMTLVQAPTGKNWDVTPMATNVYENWDYTFNVQATNVELEIIDMNTSNVLSGETNTVIVGQQMNLGVQLNITNALLQNSMLTNFQWTVPGYAISNYVVAPDTSSAMVVTNFPTTNSTAKFYWVDGGSNLTVQCSATINGATVTGQAVLTVVRPMAKITDQTSAVRMGYDENDISYGVYFGTFGSPPGILFSNVITLPQGNYNYGNTSYTSQWVQVIIPVYTGTITISSTNVYTVLLATTNVVLDTQYPYGFNANYPFPDTDDSPGVQTASPNEIAASFSQKSEMWLMFQPANGQWVPLRKVSWNAAGAATNAGAGWILTGSSWSTNPPDADTGTAFPTWTNNISDIQLLTNYIGNL